MLVATAVGGGGGADWLRLFLGLRDVGAIRPSWLAPTPQTWTTPSSSRRRVRFGLSLF